MRKFFVVSFGEASQFSFSSKKEFRICWVNVGIGKHYAVFWIRPQEVNGVQDIACFVRRIGAVWSVVYDVFYFREVRVEFFPVCGALKKSAPKAIFDGLRRVNRGAPGSIGRE